MQFVGYSMSLKTFCSKCVRDFWSEITYLLILILLASSVLPYSYQGLSFSAFYNPSFVSPAKLLNENQRRGMLATAFLRDNHFPDLFTNMNKSNTEYCLAMVTVVRPQNTLYLTQSVARLASLLTSQMKERSYSFVVYNAAGEKHAEAVQLSNIVPVIHATKKREGGGRVNGVLDAYESERHDYVEALQLCLQRKATYSIILQDDAVADQRFFQKLEFVLHHWLPKSSTWAMLKLFYPEKYQGWGNDPSMIVELLFVVLVASVSLTLLVSLILPGLTWGRPTSALPLALRLVASTAFILFAILTLGRPHWEELRKVHPYFTSAVPARGCCIPAVLYPQEHLHEVVNYLSSLHCSSAFPVDIALDKFVEEKGLQKYLTVPNIVRHIGYLSSLPKGYKSTKEFGLLFSEP